MSTLVFDTETSGLWRDDLPPLDPQQPNLVQLGAKLYDSNWIKRAQITCLIRPNGWEIEKGAEDVHHISTQTCHRYGVELVEALVPFRGMVKAAAQIAGHHVNFDRRVITASLHRAGAEGLWWSRISNKFFCTMESSTEVCQLPAEFGGYKFPSLEEAVTLLLPQMALPVLHDADSDIDATTALYRELLRRGIAIPPDPFADHPL